MGRLRSLFGPSKDEIWRQLACEIRADYDASDKWRGSKVRAHHKEWTITLDTHTVSAGKTATTYTRLRAPYVNADGFQFTIYRRGIFSNMAKFLGMQDVSVGDPKFDDAFIIQGTSRERLSAFFSNPRIRSLIMRQDRIHLQVRDDEGWFGNEFPKGVDELYFTYAGVIKDVDRLKELYELFAESLDQLCRIGSAYQKDPGVKL